MSQLSYESFASILRESLHYETPTEERRRRPLFPTAAFMARMARVYALGWHEAGKPDFELKYWPNAGYRVLQAVENTGGSVVLEGFDNVVAAGGPAVVAANHVSALETYLFPPLLAPWRSVAYILKSSLLRYPVLGRCVRSIRPIPVSRKNPVADLRAVLKHGTDSLRGGRFVVVFPQGTRQRTFDPDSWHSLGAKLALHAGVPLLPVAVATDFLRIGQWQRDLFASVHPSSTVRFRFGPPIPPSLTESEMQSRAKAFISATLAEWEKTDGRQMLLPAPQPSTPDR